MKRLKKLFAFVAATTLILTSTSCSTLSALVGGTNSSESATPIKNIILMIGDGMGKNHIRMGEIYKGEKLHMQNLPLSVSVETCSADNEVTDSSAAATAMATGVRTNNSYVGVTPDGEELTTIVDFAASLGKSTGILTTEELYGGTPMGFSGHNLYRRNYEDLVVSAASSGNVNLFAGYTCDEEYQKSFSINGYVEVPSVGKISDSEEKKIFGLYPIEAEKKSMTADEESVAFDYLLTEALEYLSKDEDGFFLMAEGAHIDHGSENNDLKWMLKELLAFDDGVKAVLDWASNRDDTIIIVTADHETGALELKDGITKKNMFAKDDLDPIYYSWGRVGHSSADVSCYIGGAKIDFAKYSFSSSERIKNIDIFKIMQDCFLGN